MNTLLITTVFAVVLIATAAFATQQQGASRCYERCTTDVTGATHCVSWCQ
jgi:hypothetical protein